MCVFVCVWWGQNSEPPFSPQFAFLETIVTAVTDEFPYYLRPKKAVFSGLICVAMYLMGLVLTTDVSGAVGWADHGAGGEMCFLNSLLSSCWVTGAGLCPSLGLLCGLETWA